MDDVFPHNRDGWPALAVIHALPTTPGLGGPHLPAEFAARMYAKESLAPPLPQPGAGEPYSLQWFLDIEAKRLGKHGWWIPRLLEFAKHSGETLLGLGSGLGTDWVQFARHGANVIVGVNETEQLALVRRNFELRNLKGRFFVAQPSCLPLESSSIDVVCWSGLLEGNAKPETVADEIFRVLKPGGKVLVLAPAKYDVAYWSRMFLPWCRWFGRHATESPIPRFSARGLHRLFGRFIEHRLHKRQLRRSELPHLWRFAPLPILERLLGRVLILRAFKPLSSALSVQTAA